MRQAPGSEHPGARWLRAAITVTITGLLTLTVTSATVTDMAVRYRLLVALADLTADGFTAELTFGGDRTGTVHATADQVTVTVGTRSWTNSPDGCTGTGPGAAVAAPVICALIPPGIGARTLSWQEKLNLVVTGDGLRVTETGPDHWVITADGAVTDLAGIPVPPVEDLHVTVTRDGHRWQVTMTARTRTGGLHVTATVTGHTGPGTPVTETSRPALAGRVGRSVADLGPVDVHVRTGRARNRNRLRCHQPHMPNTVAAPCTIPAGTAP